MKRALLLTVSVMMIAALQFVGVHAQAKAKSMTVTGSVKSISATSLAVNAGGKDMTFTIDNSTKFVGKGLSTKSGGAKMAPSDAVSANDRVKVEYHDMSGTMHAAVVTVTNKAATAAKK
jgi:hypothetical protein